MNKILLIVMFIMSTTTGCNMNMSNTFEMATKISQASTPIEESRLVEEFVNEIRIQRTPITVEVADGKGEVSIHDLEGSMESKLVVTISFDDGKKFKWEPLDNKNIYFLLRE